MLYPHNSGYWALRAGILSLTFGLAVWALRAATPAAALCGAMICLLVTIESKRDSHWLELHSGLTPLLTLFLLTFAAGKLGRSRKRAALDPADLAEADFLEEKHGRTAAQVIANLGIAGLIAAATLLAPSLQLLAPASKLLFAPTLLLAALAEATADTVSSEIGSAFGGTPILLTTLRRVPPGTDGAVSLLGTLSGILSAAFVTLAGAWSMHLTPRHALCALAAATLGLFVDSLLGATLERRGLLGNDLVNFLSTLTAALAAALLITL